MNPLHLPLFIHLIQQVAPKPDLIRLAACSGYAGQPQVFIVETVDGNKVGSIRGPLNTLVQIVQNIRICIRGGIISQNHVRLIPSQRAHISNSEILHRNPHRLQTEILADRIVLAIRPFRGQRFHGRRPVIVDIPVSRIRQITNPVPVPVKIFQIGLHVG